MANNCWNWVSFTGDKKTLNKLENKFKKYDKTSWFTQFGDIVLDKKKREYEGQHFDFYYQYGTKWWEFDIQRDDDDCLVIMGDSAWSPPLELTLKISKKYKLWVHHEFEEGGCDFAGKHEYKNGEIITKDDMTYQEYRYLENPDGFWDDVQMYIDDTDSWEEFIENIDKEVITIMKKENTLKHLKNEYKKATEKSVQQN